jgi:hypothetical protein
MTHMSPMNIFIKELCAEVEALDPDWELCPTCGSVIPYLKKNLDKGGVSATKIRVRVLLKQLRDRNLTKYNDYNTRFKLL